MILSVSDSDIYELAYPQVEVVACPRVIIQVTSQEFPHSSLLLDQSWLNMGKGWCLIFFYFTLVGITALWSHHSAARWSDFVQIEQGSGSWQVIKLWFLSVFSLSQRHMNRLLLQTSMWKAGTLYSVKKLISVWILPSLKTWRCAECRSTAILKVFQEMKIDHFLKRITCNMYQEWVLQPCIENLMLDQSLYHVMWCQSTG